MPRPCHNPPEELRVPLTIGFVTRLSEPLPDEVRIMESPETQHLRYFEDDYKMRTMYDSDAANLSRKLFLEVP